MLILIAESMMTLANYPKIYTRQLLQQRKILMYQPKLFKEG